MKIHKVRAPFMSRIGQFEPGQRTLAIGLDVNSLMGTDAFCCYLGESKKCYYEIDCKEALILAQNYNSFWTNKAGKKVAILPIKDFQRKEVKE